ncbi:unnamed protein product [Symbiodinium sp. KB8]|nr:unnamed protein product [Symbiodinium sp. KB8]
MNIWMESGACRVHISTCQKKMAAIRMVMTKSTPLVAGRHYQRTPHATTAEPENIVSLSEAMAMKYLGAYLMAVLGGKESPSAEDIKTILEAGGISYEDDLITKICERMEGKQAHELIKEGFGKFAACGGGGGGGGGGGAAPAAGGGGDAPAAEEKKKVEEEEEEEEMDFDLIKGSATCNAAMSAARLISVADLHGDFQRAVQILAHAGLIDRDSHAWIGGDSVLVQTGDIVDRGGNAKQIYKLFFSLREQALQAGGKVINLLGNHEVMNLKHDWRYVSEEDIAGFGGEEQREQAWSPTGWLGSEVRKFPVAVIVEKILFVHAGLMPNIIAHRSLDSLNDEVHLEIAGSSSEWSSLRSELLGPRGPVWARDYAHGGAAACSKLKDVLSRLGARRMVVGHTIQQDFRAHTRCDGQIILADTAISRIYGGAMSYLEHEEGGATVVYPATDERFKLPLSGAVEAQAAWNSISEPVQDQEQVPRLPAALGWRQDLAVIGILILVVSLGAWRCRSSEKPEKHAT